MDYAPYSAEIDRAILLKALDDATSHYQEAATAARAAWIADAAEMMVRTRFLGPRQRRGLEAATALFDNDATWSWGRPFEFRQPRDRGARAKEMAERLRSEALQHIRVADNVLGWLKDFLP